MFLAECGKVYRGKGKEKLIQKQLTRQTKRETKSS